MSHTLDLLLQPWAILPAKKAQIDAIYEAHIAGEKVDFAAIEAAIGHALGNQPVGYTVDADGIATIEMSGVMSRRMNVIQKASGGVSTEQLAGSVRDATDDDSVTAILLVIDSPGGAVDGLQDLVAAIRDAAATKPTAAVATTMASAAYWAGSAASKIFAESEVAVLGSIGVVVTHRDVSGAEDKSGVKTTEVAAGKFKRIDSRFAPLSPEGFAVLKGQADYVYGLMTEAVKDNRGMESREQVHDQMADGRIFIGQQAVDAGLADGIASEADVRRMLGAGDIPLRTTPAARGAVPPARAAHGTTRRSAGGVPAPTSSQLENDMPPEGTKVTAEDVKAQVDAAVADATRTFDASKPALRLEGAALERQRIADVRSHTLPGHEALIETLAFDGVTTGAEAAVRVLAAEKAKIAGVAADLAKDASAAVATHAVKPDPKDEVVAEKELPAAEQKRIATAARNYIDAQAKLGITVSVADAWAHITAPGAK